MTQYHFGKSATAFLRQEPRVLASGQARFSYSCRHPSERFRPWPSREIGKRETRNSLRMVPSSEIEAGATSTRAPSANFLIGRNVPCSRINTEEFAFTKNTSGDAFGVPRLCCLLRCLLTSSLLFSWLPSSLASLLLLSWLPLFLFSLCRVDIEPARDTLQLTNV